MRMVDRGIFVPPVFLVFLTWADLVLVPIHLSFSGDRVILTYRQCLEQCGCWACATYRQCLGQVGSWACALWCYMSISLAFVATPVSLASCCIITRIES